MTITQSDDPNTCMTCDKVLTQVQLAAGLVMCRTCEQARDNAPEFPDKPKMIARVVAKRDVQRMIKALRSCNLVVNKIDTGYECSHNGVLLFKAMNGNRNYLVRMRTDLFV